MKMPVTSIITSVLVITLVAPYSLTKQKASATDKALFQRQALSLDGEEITIIRDSFGVPHVFASTARGACFGGGYAVAQDRLYQLERFRRDARGEIAEIEGPQAFQRDAQSRRSDSQKRSSSAPSIC